MNKDEFSDSAKVPGKKGDATKSSAGNASQIKPRAAPVLSPPVPRPPFAGPMLMATNIKPLPSAVKPVKENTFLNPEKSKDE